MKPDRNTEQTRAASGHPVAQWPLGLAALGAAALYASLAFMGIEISRLPGSVATLWYANLAGAWALAHRPHRDWLLMLPLMMAANVAVNLALGDALLPALCFVPANLLETALAAWAVQRVTRWPELLRSPTLLAKALLLAGVAPALLGSVVGAALLACASEQDFAYLWPRWLEGGLIGGISLLPLVLVLLHRRDAPLLRPGRRLEAVSLLLLSAGVSLVVPLAVPYPFVYIALPLALIALRQGLALTAIANLMTSVLTGTQIGLGLLVAPPTTLHWQHVLFYLPILAVIVPPILLATAMEGYRHGLRELRASEQRFRNLYTHTPALLMSFLPDGRLVSASDLWLEKLGRQGPEVLQQPFTRFMPAVSAQRMHDVVLPTLRRTGVCQDEPCQWLTAQGELIEARLSAVWERDALGEPSRALAVIEDVTEQQRLALFAAEREFTEVTLHSIGDGVVACDPEGRVQYLNPVAAKLLGSPAEALRGRLFDEVIVLLDQDTQQRIDSPVQRCLREQRVSGLPSTALLKGAHGALHPIQDSVAPIFGREGRLMGAVMVFQDVREARAMAQRMAHLAHHDALTDLPNRVLLQDRIEQACEHSQRVGGQFGVMFLDLDHFKEVNDSLGHAAGDELLRTVARRLQTTLRQCDTICRLGGDEFVVLIGQVDSAQDLAAVADKVLAQVAQPCHVAGQTITVSISLGLALYPDDGSTVERLMKHADIAMYRAKRAGRNRYEFFSAPPAAPPGGEPSDAVSRPPPPA
ncbi:diguanylate cyclase [Curvibacter sp. HBC28]|uniref:Diguanylate cyclase n=1 Tax=Curvibacter microcysteis TaxID=3026419 RepID=A0ABT5MCG2_9BURK|nr:diguanylate cyclase [Curvibacter sp. HBC28]MDD0813584.1 diguanylate cyclase [Curvibacter sp. HBC28]